MVRLRRSPITSAIWCTALATGLCAQQTTPGQNSGLVLHGGTREVLLDFVVRDKHQREVKDIRPEEVEVFEDGAPQTIKSFQYRTGKDAAPVAAGVSGGKSESVKLDPLREINLVTMVFAGMSPLSRQQAASMAHDFLRTEPGPNTWIGVFTLKNKLAAVQSYTTDIDLLHKAVDRAATGQYQQFAQESLALIQHINALESSGNYVTFQPMQPGSAAEGLPAPDRFLAPVQVAMDQMNLRLLFRQEGGRTIDGLRAVIREQAQFPGRKTVLFFSEGLVIPPNQPELLDSLISEANRANLTFYTLDARGLSTVSNNRLSGTSYRAMQGHGDQSDAIHTDLQGNARHLATGTGGFAMDNSNDLRAPLRRLMEDVRSHYEVTYTPISTNFDGHFRKLSVHVSRPGVTVQSRAGYYALPMIAGESLAPFEMAALKVLTTQPEPHAFDFHAAALRFGPAADGHVYRVVISIPTAALHFSEESGKHLTIRVSTLSLVKDEKDQVVAKVSKDLSYEVPADKRAEFANGETTVILPLDLSAGVYHLETAVIDRVAERASVRRSVIVAPASRGGYQMSDLVWVRRLRPSQDRDVFNPLEPSAGSITPALVPAFSKSDGAHFYFVAYPASGSDAKPLADLSVSKNGTTIATVRLDLPQPNSDGSYPFLGTIPTTNLAPGEYDVQLRTSLQGQTSVLSSQFVVE